MNDLNNLNAATHRHTLRSLKLIDNISQRDPLLAYIRGDFDDFTEFVRQVREEAGIKDPK